MVGWEDGGAPGAAWRWRELSGRQVVRHAGHANRSTTPANPPIGLYGGTTEWLSRIRRPSRDHSHSIVAGGLDEMS